MATESFQPSAYTHAPLRGAHVSVDNSRAEVAGGKGCVRSCSVGGMKLTEDIVLSVAGRALGYSVRDGNPMGLSSHFAAILLEDDGRGGTLVRWQQYFDHPQPEQIAPQIFAMVGAAASQLTEIFLGR